MTSVAVRRTIDHILKHATIYLLAVVSTTLPELGFAERLATITGRSASVGSPAAIGRRAFARLRSEPGYRVRDPRRAWGQRHAIEALRLVLSTCSGRYPTLQPFVVHDISRRDRSRIPRHTTHIDGRDADIRVPRLDSSWAYVDATPTTIDLPRTWCLIDELTRACAVDFILLDYGLQRALYRYARAQRVSARRLWALLQYPALIPYGARPGRPRGAVVRHLRGHANHLHVRFRHRHRPPSTPRALSLCR